MTKHGCHVERFCRDEKYAKYVTQKAACDISYQVVCESCGLDGTRQKRLSKVLKGIMQDGQLRYSYPVCDSHRLSVYRDGFPDLELKPFSKL